MLEEIQCDSLGAEQRMRGARQAAENRSLSALFSIAHKKLCGNGGISLLKNQWEKFQTCDHALLFQDELAHRMALWLNAGDGGDVFKREIFAKRPLNQPLKF